MVFFQKWPFFDVFEIPLCWQRKKSQKMTQKWASIFFPVPRFFDFSSTEIFQKIPALEIFFKTRFLPVSIRTNAFFWFFIFFQCRDFFQKISSAGKSRHWKKMKKPFFARLQKKVPIGFLSFYYFRLAFSKNPIGIPTGDLQYRNNLQYRNKRVLPVSPTGFFFAGASPFLLPRLAPARWTLYVQANRSRWPSPTGAWGRPRPVCSHCYFLFSLLNSATNYLNFFYSFYFLTINIHFYFPTVVSKILT